MAIIQNARDELLQATSPRIATVTLPATTLINFDSVTGAAKPADNATVNNGILANLAGQITAANYATYLAAGAISSIGFAQNKSTATAGTLSTSVIVDSDGKDVIILFGGRIATSTLATTTGVQFLNAEILVEGTQIYYDSIASLGHWQATGEYQHGSFMEFLLYPNPGTGGIHYQINITMAASQGGTNNSQLAWPSILVISLKR
jgi:hypothetical protein